MLKLKSVCAILGTIIAFASQSCNLVRLSKADTDTHLQQPPFVLPVSRIAPIMESIPSDSFFIAVDEKGNIFAPKLLGNNWPSDLIPKIKAWKRQITKPPESRIPPSCPYAKLSGKMGYRSGQGWMYLALDARCLFIYIQSLLKTLLDLGEPGLAILVERPSSVVKPKTASSKVPFEIVFGFFTKDDERVVFSANRSPQLCSFSLNLTYQQKGKPVTILIAGGGKIKILNTQGKYDGCEGEVQQFPSLLRNLKNQWMSSNIELHLDDNVTIDELVTVLDAIAQNGIDGVFLSVTNIALKN